MAGGFYGADVAQLQDLSKQFDSGAERLTTLTMQLSKSINGTAAWKGADADDFRMEWNSRDKAQLLAAGKALRAGSKSLRANAQQQATASDGAIAGPGTGGSLPAGSERGASTWDTLADGGKAVWENWGLARNLTGLARFAAGADELAAWARGIPAMSDLRDAFNAGQLGQAFKVDALQDALRLDVVYSDLKKMDDLISLGEKGGKFLGGAGIVLDTVSAVQNFREGDYLATGYDAFKVALGVACFAPPPASLIAAGASGLLAVGELVYENWDSISGTASDAWNATTEAAGEAWNATTEAAGEAWDAGTEAVDDVMDAGEDFVEGVGETLSDLNPF